MNNEKQTNGFSLTEVLLAVGTLAIGMLFIAGVFPVGIHFTTIATERTIAAIAADEAFAKIKLYDNYINLGNLQEQELTTFNDDILSGGLHIDETEFTYPSNEDTDISQKQYCWSALCRRTVGNLVQVTVFVCRKTGSNLRYHQPGGGTNGDFPVPVKVSVSGVGVRDNELRIESGKESFINDGYTIVDDESGRIYRVMERYRALDDTILLDRYWDQSDPGGPPQIVWVIPPPAGGGRYPCIAIYQKVIKF
ncbi:MAG: type IV pilus modification PilV family protein [Planctomycetota bacterium]|jgi:Tfp pilus assembly protein PilV